MGRYVWSHDICKFREHLWVLNLLFIFCKYNKWFSDFSIVTNIVIDLALVCGSIASLVLSVRDSVKKWQIEVTWLIKSGFRGREKKIVKLKSPHLTYKTRYYIYFTYTNLYLNISIFNKIRRISSLVLFYNSEVLIWISIVDVLYIRL